MLESAKFQANDLSHAMDGCVITKNPLDFVLQLTCSDLNCYGESFQPQGELLAFRSAFFPESTRPSEELKSFSLTAGSETYAADVGIVGSAGTAPSYLIRSLAVLTGDQYFFSAGGPRLAISANHYRTVITIPLRSQRQSTTGSGMQNCTGIGGCLNYRQAPLIGVVVLYLTKPPKLLTELQRYLDSVMRCASPLIELSAERALYERRVRRGGNKYRRLRRALLSTIRAKKKRSQSFPPETVDGSDLEVGKNRSATQGTVENEDEHGASGGAGHKLYLELSTLESHGDSNVSSAMDSGDKRANCGLDCKQARTAALKNTRAYLRKWQGGKVLMPARQSLESCLIASAACLLTIACWQLMADAINEAFSYHGVVEPISIPGTFGALCTIIFALPAVPLAQPRIVVLAHTWTMTVATVLLFIFEQYRHVWLQKALVVAVSVAGMAKFGVLNPPAGAVGLTMITYANSAAYSIHGWLFLIVSTYLGCAVCIFVGVMWHNLFTGRVYPLFW